MCLSHLSSIFLNLDLRQSPIPSAHILRACVLENATTTTVFLCLNQTITFSAPSKDWKILHINARILGFKGMWVFFVTKFYFTERQSLAGHSSKYMEI